MNSLSIMFIAGDPSGDHHASVIVKRLKDEAPGCDIWGIGGPKMQSSGLRALFPFEPFNKMGFLEVALHISFFLKMKKLLIAEMKKNRPDCLVCVDYPGFNMHLLKAASEMGIPVVWYIAPMVWAWKAQRAKILAQYASYIACIFPFEVCYFKPFTDKVSFVGNPLVEAIATEKKIYRKSHRTCNKIAIVPGSRNQEIQHLIEPMTNAYGILKKKYPNISAEMSRCNSLPEKKFKKYTDIHGITLFDGPLTELFARCDCAIVTSGTATLEAALAGIPHVIVYKTSILTYLILKQFLKIPYIGLPNIISQEMVVPECIQKDAVPTSIADALDPFFFDHSFYRSTASKLIRIRNHLGAHRPSEELFRIISTVVKTKLQS